MSVDNRGYQSDNERTDPPSIYDDHFEEDEEDLEPEFSTYFSDQKVEIPILPDDNNVSIRKNTKILIKRNFR